MSLLTILFCVAALLLLARIADNTRKPANPADTFPCQYEGEYATLPGIERELARERARWFPGAAKLAALEARHAYLSRIVAESAKHQADWEAAHPGMDYGYFHTEP